MKSENRTLKNKIKNFKTDLCQALHDHKNIQSITRQLVHFIDDLLVELFNRNGLHQFNHFCLVALGSYGRRELQLYSDIDILLLHTEQVAAKEMQAAQSFIQNCWDCGLEISHQITTVNAVADLAEKDISVISSIMDVHLICGSGSLMEELIYKTHPLHMWPSKSFFETKLAEQKIRHAKYGDTAYNLEPNIKNGPGGIRDLNLLLSISKRHFNINKLADGIYMNFITDKEYEELLSCQLFLWRVRFALHMLAQKKEDRLLFDYQVKLAQFFGYRDKPHSLAIEQFMKAYFKVLKQNRELNELLMQWFYESILLSSKQQLVPLDKEFQLSNNYIEVRHADVIKNRPQAIFSLFIWIAKKPEIEGVRASTIRLIRHSLYLINKSIKSSPKAKQLFIKLLKTEPNVYEALQRMNRYGVLARYLDCFAAVTGQMQYDLFHVYTVDQHTLFVIRNLCRFQDPIYGSNFPLCAQLFSSIKHKHILYLSALFHDIAKGRDGDHSDLGAIEAHKFAISHKLNKDETELLAWLVQNHLLMSTTAQRQDIYDPEIIQKFCKRLPKSYHLDYLYLLTVADICATNPTLWNSWKDSLLKELYHSAKQVLQQNKVSPDEETSYLHQRQEEALALLKNESINVKEVKNLWNSFTDNYFLHEPPQAIARHTKSILQCSTFPLVSIMPHHSQGGTEVFIYMPHRDDRFIITTTVLTNFNATVQEASIVTCNNHYDLDTYIVLDQHGKAFSNQQRISQIQKALISSLKSTSKQLPIIAKRRVSRIQAHFEIKLTMSFAHDLQKKQTTLFLIAKDNPGLLAKISRVFFRLHIHLHNAKIATVGERVEDMFYITNANNRPLTDNEVKDLKTALTNALSQ